MYDELELDMLGDRKTALFLIMSDTDSTFNFLISMVYTQLFNLLCDKADDQYGGKLPIHVRCLIDECANIGAIPQLEKLVATIRSREISACLVLQTRSQLKAIAKKADQPTHVLIDQNPAFSTPSMVQAEQIFTIDKSRVQRFLGRITPSEMYRIEAAVINSLDLNGG